MPMNVVLMLIVQTSLDLMFVDVYVNTKAMERLVLVSALLLVIRNQRPMHCL